MSLAKRALASGAVSFVIGFAVASLVGNEKSGLKAGAVSAVIGAGIALGLSALGGAEFEDLEELEEIEDLAEDVTVEAEED